PGRMRTGSSPSSTRMAEASYPSDEDAAGDCGIARDADAAAFSAGAAAFCVASGLAVSGTPEKRSLLSSMEVLQISLVGMHPASPDDPQNHRICRQLCESTDFAR